MVGGRANVQLTIAVVLQAIDSRRAAFGASVGYALRYGHGPKRPWGAVILGLASPRLDMVVLFGAVSDCGYEGSDMRSTWGLGCAVWCQSPYALRGRGEEEAVVGEEKGREEELVWHMVEGRGGRFLGEQRAEGSRTQQQQLCKRRRGRSLAGLSCHVWGIWHTSARKRNWRHRTATGCLDRFANVRHSLLPKSSELAFLLQAWRAATADACSEAWLG
ncbi:hypothetical protein AXG93_725s1050 [Marchantia polymorpha subsp. ruderalis]|uniref:Uncharacterized protein n=1 Tax=Marchantia polymorpha subsp. ruderalis TaxID=1480154 RepID=A0A176WGZ3_MARPO|nr:hypothetical protein AXG93_725s1050 [Marchantia polymorpha subsp. ruderalis]